MSDFKNWHYIFGNISTAFLAIGIDFFTHAIERGVPKTLKWNLYLGPKFLKFFKLDTYCFGQNGPQKPSHSIYEHKIFGHFWPIRPEHFMINPVTLQKKFAYGESNIEGIETHKTHNYTSYNAVNDNTLLNTIYMSH